MKVLSCGLIVRSPAGFLLAHATRTSRWDIPKGRIEPGETPQQAAMREAWEETGIDFAPWADQMTDLGRHPYIKAKDLHTFLLTLDQPLDLAGCTCHTHVVMPSGARFPETDRWAWVPEEGLAARMGPSLLAYMQRLGYATAAVCTSRAVESRGSAKAVP